MELIVWGLQKLTNQSKINVKKCLNSLNLYKSQIWHSLFTSLGANILILTKDYHTQSYRHITMCR